MCWCVRAAGGLIFAQHLRPRKQASGGHAGVLRPVRGAAAHHNLPEDDVRASAGEGEEDKGGHENHGNEQHLLLSVLGDPVLPGLHHHLHLRVSGGNAVSRLRESRTLIPLAALAVSRTFWGHTALLLLTLTPSTSLRCS